MKIWHVKLKRADFFTSSCAGAHMGFCRRFDRPSTSSLIIHPSTQTPVVSTKSRVTEQQSCHPNTRTSRHSKSECADALRWIHTLTGYPASPMSRYPLCLIVTPKRSSSLRHCSWRARRRSLKKPAGTPLKRELTFFTCLLLRSRHSASS